MSIGEGGGNALEFETMEGRSWPSITQYSVFLENRVGMLLHFLRTFSGSKVRIIGLSISDSIDCCIARVVLSHPEQGRELLQLANLTFAENDLLVVELPHGHSPLVEICAALLQAEVNIHYAYPLIVHPLGRSAIALHVDNNELAGQTLRDKGFEILCEADLSGP